jgi:hypothetical protein
MRLDVYDERRHHFARLRDRRVLVYWPHGFGDFVHFGYVAPLLEPSNAYFITRFGDDFVHLYDGCGAVTPMLSGARRVGDGSELGAKHLGIDWKRIRNRESDVILPEPLRTGAIEAKIDTLLYTDYPEYEGRLAFPYHTKARALIRDLVDPERLRTIDLRRPLGSALPFAAPRDVRARIEERLRTFVAPGEHLYLLAPGGHTNLKKSLEPQEVQRFASTLAAYDARARLVVISEEELARVFGDLDVAFAHLLVTLVRACHAFAGVAAGPLHAALAMQSAPVAGIWLAHHPDWYDEPYDDALHLLGPLVCRKHFDRRKATTTKPAAMRAKTIGFPDRVPNAHDAVMALDALLR